MFGFKKTSELDRLRGVYAEQTDSELLRLHQDREGLTEAAQQALSEAISQRGLEKGADAADVSEATTLTLNHEVSSGEDAIDEVMLLLCRDVNQLRDLSQLLEETGIAFRLEEYSQLVGTQQDSGVKVFVERSRERRANALLRQVLFASGPDQEEPPPIAYIPPGELVLLLTCRRKDALGIVNALSEDGISFYWRDGREDEDLLGEEGVALAVDAAQRERAEKAVQMWMASRPAEDDEETAAVEA